MPSSCAVSTVQVRPFSDEPAPLSGAQMMAANPYRPWPARITSITLTSQKGENSVSTEIGTPIIRRRT